MIHAELGNADLVGDCDASAAQGDYDYLFRMPGDHEPTQPNRVVNIQLPRQLKFLLRMHRFKVIYGGRGGGKSWAVADALLALGAAQKLRILCAREVQKSIAQSVHQLLKDRIVALGLESFYQVLDTEIRGGNGTLIVFSGLGEHTVTSIKSFEGIDIVWVEEAQSVSKKSWDILIPTIRAKGSEIWVTFNPDMDTDDTWKRFILNPPDDKAPFDCVSVKMNWNDNKNFPEVLAKERLHAKRSKTKEDYDNIWEGVCRSSIIGAIYAKEMAQMVTDRRCVLVPYDPRLQVHFIWDLGWNDAMTVGVVQKPTPSHLAFINYLEDSFQRYDEIILRLKAMRYTRWGWHWLPHDGDHKNPQTGKSPRMWLRDLGCRVKPVMQLTGPEARIKAAREVFPRIMIDGVDRTEPGETGYVGGARLLECLRRYSRITPKTTNEPASAKHDEFCFTGDTEILTRRGKRRIMDLESEEVLTPCGFVPFKRLGITLKNAQLVEVKFTNGYTVRCTPEHLFLTEDGWKSASSLTSTTRIRSSLTLSRNILMARYGACGQVIDIFHVLTRACTERFGLWLLGPYRVVATYITKTASQLTTLFQTLNACPHLSISSLPGRKLVESGSSARRLKRGHARGTNLLKDFCGTGGTHKRRNLGRNGNERSGLVSIVRKAISGLLEIVAPSKSTAARFASTSIEIKSVAPLPYRADVWCIDVPNGAWFTLANGAVVHNCHGADMFGAACEIADKIIDDEYVDRGPPVPAFDNHGNPGMGPLGA